MLKFTKLLYSNALVLGDQLSVNQNFIIALTRSYRADRLQDLLTNGDSILMNYMSMQSEMK